MGGWVDSWKEGWAWGAARVCIPGVGGQFLVVPCSCPVVHCVPFLLHTRLWLFKKGRQGTLGGWNGRRAEAGPAGRGPGGIREQMLDLEKVRVSARSMFQGHVGVSGTQG